MLNDSDNQIGLPLTTPSTQTIIPIICGGNGNIQGFFTIASTTFAGTETSFALAEGDVPIQSVTLPTKVSDGHNYGVKQYMAAVFDDDLLLQRPWIGYSSWVDTNDTGYTLSYVMATSGWLTRLQRGTLLTNLLVNMAATPTVAAAISAPTLTAGTMRWVASMSVNSAQLEAAFFDFCWTTLFAAQSKSADPLSIAIVSNPVGGVFKATMVPNPVIMPLGGVQFNTVRIIKLATAAPGTYTFVFAVTDTKNQTTNVNLVLTIV